MRTSFETILDRLASKQLALILFLLLCLSLVPGTFSESGFQAGTFTRAIIAGMALNLVLCTVRRIRTIARPVLAMHIGAVLTMAGGVVSSLGFVGTVNVYEGTSVNAVYRWDKGRDLDLGFDLAVRGINAEYYPVPVRVGVLKGREKYRLVEARTGERFDLDGYTVSIDSLDVPSEVMKLSVFRGDRLIGRFDTSGTRKSPPDFGYDFRLVAFKDPLLKRMTVDLALSRAGQVITEGTTEVNSPFEWNGMYFYHTLTELDRYGVPYAGIQVVKDPGKPLVYLGFAMVTGGSLWWMRRRIYSPEVRKDRVKS